MQNNVLVRIVYALLFVYSSDKHTCSTFYLSFYSVFLGSVSMLAINTYTDTDVIR